MAAWRPIRTPRLSYSSGPAERSPAARSTARLTAGGSTGLICDHNQCVDLTVAGFILALVAIPISVLATWHWGNRRRKLVFAWEATALVPDAHGAGGDLGVTYRGHPVDNPYLLKLRLLNAGPKNFATSDFDNNQPLVMNLHCTMYGLVRSSHPGSTHTTVGSTPGSEGVVKLSPMLLRHRDEWAVEAVVGGQPRRGWQRRPT